MSTTFFVFAALLMVTSTLGHSQMRCAKYDMKTGKCYAPIRDAPVSFEQEANKFSETGKLCHTRMTNPITSAYAYGSGCGYLPCPDPMGSIAQGETFTVMWVARNHAVAEQNPGSIALYLSPVEADNQGSDVSNYIFEQNKICEASYMSCNGQNGDLVQCYATCKMPANTVVGIHTLLWKWTWNQAETSIYTTCADLHITAGSGSSTPPVTTPTTPVTPTPVTPTPTTPSTTGKKVVTPAAPTTPSTTGKKVVTSPAAPSTTGANAPVVVSPPSTVTPSATSPTTPTSGCNLGDQICVGTTQYQTCTNGRDANYWAAPQSCGARTTCEKSKNPGSLNKIYCV